MEKSEKGVKMKSRMQRIRGKILSSYYGNPIKDMKMICVVGAQDAVPVARLVHEILQAAGLSSAVLAADTPIKAGTLHKFLNEAWKAKNHYVVVTAPVESLKNNVFHGLPVHVAALTDTTDEVLEVADSLFAAAPAIVVLNHDDVNYGKFEQYVGATDTYTYGRTTGATVRIDNSKLYARGTEANLIFGNKTFTVASFLTGEPVVSQMAGAATVATALHVAPAAIAEGVANLETLEGDADETAA